MAAYLCVVVNVLLVLGCALMTASGHLPQVCDPSRMEAVSKPFPTLPKQFSTTIEANIFSKKMEISVREYFDEIGNRGRMEISRNGSFSYGVFDYASEELFMLPDFFSESDEECVVRKIAEENDFVRVTFGFTLQNGSVHIGTASEFFSFAYSASTLKYIGNDESIRGIPCDHWQTCYSSNSSSYTIDYYFSRTDAYWTSAYRDDPVPVQIVLDGVREEDEDGFRNVTNIYSFIAFNAGPDAVPDDLFKIPTGVSCKGRIPGQALPMLPDFFSTYIESVYEETQTVYVARVRHGQINYTLLYKGSQEQCINVQKGL